MIATAIIIIISVTLLGTAIAVIADRAARASAWRQIALERRWNYEHNVEPNKNARF